MTGLDETLESVMGPTAVVQFAGQRLQLYRHPADGRVVAFADPADAFQFAVSLEIAGAGCTSTVAAPEGELIHLLDPGITAFDLSGSWEQAA
jgi:hypothetical protein